MTVLVCDIEADGLLDTITKIHCLVTKNMETGQIARYTLDQQCGGDGPLATGIRALEQADKVIFHNYIGYDRKVLKKFYPNFKEPRWEDTYILSQMFFANEMKEHGIAAWGRRFKRPKPSHEDWTELSEEMLHRCTEDVEILSMLWQRCNKCIDRYDCRRAIDLEYKVYEIYSDNCHWEMNIPRLEHFIKRLTVLKAGYENKIIKIAGPQPRSAGALSKIYKKCGDYNANVVKYCESSGLQLNIVAGPFSKITWEGINPQSTVQLVQWLLGKGWIPDEYNIKKDPQTRKPMKGEDGKPIYTTPTLTNSTFTGIDDKFRPVMHKFNTVKHRLGVLEGWAKRQKDGVIETFAYTCGTNTARFKHRSVANIPKADGSTFFGKAMRSLFIAPAGKILVGCDASQLESRIEGHFTTRFDQGAYAWSLLNEDQHTKTANELGITRNQGKTLNYALQYGASFKKIATMLEVSESDAKSILDKYWDLRPASVQLKEALISSVKARGYDRRDNLYNTRAYLKTIDKRPVFVRSWHSLVNSLIQSTGMICMKVALCLAQQKIKKLGLDAKLAIMYHDEYQWICNPDQGEQLVKVLQESIKEAGEYFNLTVPLESEAKIGKNWSQTH